MASTPAGSVAAVRKAAAGGPVNVVLESTAMAWFVAAVAGVRAGIDHRLFRVSGTKAAALRKLVREATRVQGRIRSTLHWAAPGMLTGRDRVSDGFVAILARWPDLRRLARARTSTIAKTGQVSKTRATRIRDATAEAVDFYDTFVDFDALAVEFEVATAHLDSLQTQVDRLERRIHELHRQHPDDVLLTVPGVGQVVAAVILAMVGNLQRFANLAAFRAYQWRDLDGTPITRQHACEIAQSLRVDPDT